MRGRALFITLAVCGAAAAVVVALTSASSPGAAGRLQDGSVSEHGHVYRYALYVPARRADSPLPLVVVLHGCTMTADEMAAASGYDAVAEEHRFVVLYPDVDAIDDIYGRCWKAIWEPGADGRGRGDAGAIARMTRNVTARWHIDRRRVYVIGISAGAFEAATLGADYPDLYAAIGIHSGAAYMGGGPGCLVPTESPGTTRSLAHATLAAMAARARLMPVIVIHGDTDGTIPIRCGQQAVSQWLQTDDLLLARDGRALLPTAPTAVRHAVVPGGHAYSVASYAERSGCVVVEFWAVRGMGHFWSGGSSDPSSARYSDPRGPSAAIASWAFFSSWSLSGPAAPCARAEP